MRAISIEVGIEILLKNLDVPTKPILGNKMIQKYIVFAEYLRFILNKLSINEKDEIEPIHIKKLLNAVNGHLEGIWTDLKATKNIEEIDSYKYIESSDLLKWTLSNLALLRDCIYVHNGFWLPTPVRLIELPDLSLGESYVAVIGTRSTKEIKSILPKVRALGIGRIIRKEDLPDDLFLDSNLWQSFNDWVGWIPSDTLDWTRKACNYVQRYGSTSLSSFNQFEVFLSDNPLKYKSKRKWLHYEIFLSFGTTMVMLCRTISKPRSYFLGVFEEGILRKEFVVNEKEKILWLLNGLQLLHKYPIKAVWYKNELNVIQTPSAVDRLLSIFSYRIPSNSGYPRYYIHPDYREYINSFLKNLGYSIINREDKGK
ncbi:hypothetical protein [Gorillibacterium sp. sgz500922]|uniref:hypothetical protein n=1 Tax=Gorillibacterium sp. sgz500922 TaxID=3446694 RepID=UPI003F678795